MRIVKLHFELMQLFDKKLKEKKPTAELIQELHEVVTGAFVASHIERKAPLFETRIHGIFV